MTYEEYTHNTINLAEAFAAWVRPLMEAAAPAECLLSEDEVDALLANLGAEDRPLTDLEAAAALATLEAEAGIVWGAPCHGPEEART